MIVWVIAGLLGLATGLRIGWALVNKQSLVSTAMILALGSLGLGMVAAGLSNRGVRDLLPVSVRHPFPPGPGGGRAPSPQAEGLTSVAHGTGV